MVDDAERIVRQTIDGCLLLIELGHIVDYPLEKRDMFCSPTISDHLSDSERGLAFLILQNATKLVLNYATATGWRSDWNKSYQDWRAYRANDCHEMATVMREIQNAL